MDFFGGKQNQAEKAREAMRDLAVERGLADENGILRLGGGEYDIYNNPHEIGWWNEGTQKGEVPAEYQGLVAALDPLGYIMSGGKGDPNSFEYQAGSGMSGILTNAIARSGGDRGAGVREAYQGYYGTSDPMNARNQAGTDVWNLYRSGKITDRERNAYLAEIDKQFGVENPTGYVAPLDKEERPRASAGTGGIVRRPSWA